MSLKHEGNYEVLPRVYSYINVALVDLVDEHMRDAAKTVFHPAEQSAHCAIHNRAKRPTKERNKCREC